MGTRCDFYIGFGTEAEWLGSVAWDGYQWEEDRDADISKATTEDEFRKSVAAEFSDRDDATLPENGWPWPWDDSRTTDRQVVFADGQVQHFAWGAPIDCEDDDVEKRDDWPNMKDHANVVIGGKRSGIMVFTAPKEETK